MDSGPENDVFDLFGLENDKDIDFETAYKMISKFDEEISLFNDGSALPKLDVAEHKSLEVLAFHHGSPKELHTEEQAKFDELPNWDSHSRGKNGSEQQVAQLNNFEETQALARAELLSRYESNAIEHFLDSLISQKDERTHSHDISETINMADLEMPTETKQEIRMENTEPDSLSLDVYIPPIVKVPEFAISDSDAPKEITDNATKLRKWKHVETERLRRNNIKKVFDDLIGMTRYPRLTDPKITKPTTEKRVPKHMLLNFILEDLRLIPRANEELEVMLRECDRIKG